ncbi:hypothetical protein EVAR_93368_1 [Eumeta japonica]|uniref:Uncharacterized protein n=1 Tax=Eumeta variegata TaxID=151549 RepID=A0A4C1UTM3_EUMVA|nr:hypothetical protein EVAR_93368_1 [Eumeta japonica]
MGADNADGRHLNDNEIVRASTTYGNELATKASQRRKTGTRGRKRKGGSASNLRIALFAGNSERQSFVRCILTHDLATINIPRVALREIQFWVKCRGRCYLCTLHRVDCAHTFISFCHFEASMGYLSRLSGLAEGVDRPRTGQREETSTLLD